MDIIYLLIPLAFLLVLVMVAVYFWAVKSGQFDDLEGPGFSVLNERDEADPKRQRPGDDSQSG